MKGINTEHRILMAAEEVFLDKGFSAAKTTEIARKAEVNHVLVQGAPLDLNKTYRVVANDYIAKGNDFYQELTKAQATETFPVSLRAVILDWVKTENLKGRHINATLDGRIYEDKE